MILSHEFARMILPHEFARMILPHEFEWTSGVTPNQIKHLHKSIFDTMPISDRLALSTNLLYSTLIYGRDFPELPGGEYRTYPVHVRLATGESIRMPASCEVPALVERACEYINSRWHTADPFHLAASFMINIGWAHPFPECNGRTCRVAAHLIICSRLGLDAWLGPGTLPDIIVDSRHLPTLVEAIAIHTHGVGHVRALENLLRDCFHQERAEDRPYSK